MTRSRELSLARKVLKASMAEAGLSKLSLPKIQELPNGDNWIPLNLVAQRQPSPVRVTRKGIPKYVAREQMRQSVNSGMVPKSSPPWWGV